MWKLLPLAVLSLSIARAPEGADVRGVRPVNAAAPPRASAARFDPAQSAALFVGVRQFADPALAPVRYAVDDAIDLAYAFSMERKTNLVVPQRVVLALSGEPHKDESRQRKDALVAAGARVVEATRENVVVQLHAQAREVGGDGAFVIAFATHGFTDAGVPYVLALESRLGQPESALSTARVLDIAASSPARASLVFVDACRERLVAARGSSTPAQSAAPPLDAMRAAEGQVVFYAAAAGRYAYDDDRLRNGVFTAAVLEGLRCKAADGPRGVVTVESLSKYVEKRVRGWVQRNRDRSIRGAIQVNLDGATGALPLATCGVPGPQPARADVRGASISVTGDDGSRLWSRRLDGIVDAAVADLDGDGRREVIAGMESGSVVAFDAAGERLWTANTNAPPNYDAGGALTIRALLVGDLFRRKERQVIVIASAAREGAPSRLCIFDGRGALLSAYWHPGRLQQVVIDRLTARHAPKLIVSASDSVFLFDPKHVRGEAPPYRGKLGSGSHLWYGVATAPIERVETIDRNNDGRRDIALVMKGGETLYLNFDGEVIEGTAGFRLLARK